MHPKFVLASTSRYRAALLAQLRLPFTVIDPESSEVTTAGETPEQKAIRLARLKATDGAHKLRATAKTIVLGSDQVAAVGQQHLSKPGNFKNAEAQLKLCSGRTVTYYTAICLCNELGEVLAKACDQYQITFRELSSEQIRYYLEQDQPFDCAGSIKAESLGIALCKANSGNDINTLYGLPLILLTDLLAELNVDVLTTDVS